MKQVGFILLVWICATTFGTGNSRAQDPPTRPLVSGASEKAWAAKLEGVAFLVSDVDYHLARTTGLRGLSKAAKEMAQAQALEHLIDRKLIVRKLQNDPLWIGPSQLRMVVELEIARIKDAGLTLAEFLSEKKVSEDYWRLDVEWNAGWTTYLQKKFSDDQLQKYYESRRHDFDGSQVLIAQVLLKYEGPQSLDLANELKSRIDRGEITFVEAVDQYSIAPSKQNEGRVGWISRWEPMPEAYSALAFKLKPGEISQPLETVYGLHLLKCLETKSGKKLFRDALDDVRRSIAQEEFDNLRKAVRAEKPKIEHSNDFPHFDETGKLVVGGK